MIKPEFPEDAEDYSINEINLSERPLMILNLAGEMGLLALTNLADEVKEEIEVEVVGEWDGGSVDSGWLETTLEEVNREDNVEEES